MTGNIVVDSPFGRLVGFENHSGRTVLDTGQQALGTVRQGFGNNGDTGDEGAIVANTIGTYLHGPVLPKNPALADHLLLGAQSRRYDVDELEPLDDELALRAAKVAAPRPQGPRSRSGRDDGACIASRPHFAVCEKSPDPVPDPGTS